MPTAEAKKVRRRGFTDKRFAPDLIEKEIERGLTVVNGVVALLFTHKHGMSGSSGHCAAEIFPLFVITVVFKAIFRLKCAVASSPVPRFPPELRPECLQLISFVHNYVHRRNQVRGRTPAVTQFLNVQQSALSQRDINTSGQSELREYRRCTLTATLPTKTRESRKLPSCASATEHLLRSKKVFK